jgi:peptidoglycan/LPS O-acetylase OafA/YrhL
MMRLADVVHGRDNNFHLLRLGAATAVLLSHSYPLSNGDLKAEPLRADFGCTFGSIAVDLFFLISGLLVTMSLMRRSSAVDFARARFFRIWPGLFVALLLTILVLGPAFTTLPLSTYFTSKETVKYLAYNVVLLKGVAYTLPGVFEANPSPNAVNGSLWTLPAEVWCYIALVAGWTVLRLLTVARHFKWAVVVIWIALFAWHALLLQHLPLEGSRARLWLMFCSGALLYILRNRITLSVRWLVVALACIALTAGHDPVFGLTYSVALPYVMLCIAYMPRGKILEFNRLGDYSYGTYIYAYPVQQSLIHVFPSLGPMALFAASLGATLPLAIASWHFIEKPATDLARPRRKVAPPAFVSATPES